MNGGTLVVPQAAATFDEAVAQFVALRASGLDPKLTTLVAGALGSAFAIGAAWAAQHAVRVVHDSVEARLAHADAMVKIMEAMVRVHAQALGLPDSSPTSVH